MQNEEKTKRKSPYRVLQQRKLEEDKNWENLPEIEDISPRSTLLHYELRNLGKWQFRASGRHARVRLATRLKRLFIAIGLILVTCWIIWQFVGFKLSYASNPHAMRYKLNCGNIPLEEQGENCSILRARVIETDNK